ncbi:cytochrome C oxidase subunit I, partial [Halobacteriales archaeon SW_7_65_23]
IVQTFSGRRLVGRKWFVIAMALVAIQSFIVWMHHMFLTTINLPIKTIMMVTTIGISLPFDLMVFALIYTMIKGRVRWKTPFLFVLGALLIFIVGGITGVFLGAIVLDYSFRGTYWVVAHFHYVMASGAVALIGALYYWYPKITGKMYNEFLGKLHFVVAFVSFNLLYFPMFVVWETPRRMFEYSAGFTLWHRVASVGAVLFAASFVIMIYNLFMSLYSDRVVDDSPWAYTGSTEWAVPSPPPTENFPGTPSFTSGSLRFLEGPEATDGGVEADETAPDGGQVTAAADHGHEPHPDHASWWPVFAGSAALLAGLGLSGLSPSLFIWPFLFALPAFVYFVGAVGARRDGFTPLHGAFLTASFLVFAGFLALFHLAHGVITGLQSAPTYFWLALSGSLLGVYALVNMGFESFYVPEPTSSEQWPFGEVENTKLGMWMFLGSDIILFGAFIGSYVFTRFEFGWQDWWHVAHEVGGLEHHPVWPGLLNTYILLASSFTVVLALVFARRGVGTTEIGPLSIENRKLTLGFIGTTFLGACLFLLNKGIEWVDLYYHQEWTFNADIMSSTFYLTTGLHAAHVVIGMMIMLFLMVRSYTGAYQGEENARTIEYFGLYWHFVDIVWLFLFPLFYIL